MAIPIKDYRGFRVWNEIDENEFTAQKCTDIDFALYRDFLALEEISYITIIVSTEDNPTLYNGVINANNAETLLPAFRTLILSLNVPYVISVYAQYDSLISSTLGQIQRNTQATNTALTTVNSKLDTIIANQQAQVAAFGYHTETDLQRWQEVADLREQVLLINSSMQNLEPDTDNAVNIEAEAQGEGYTVTAPMGGIVSFTALNILISVATLYVNGAESWSSAGLTLAIGGINDHREVNPGDVITATGMTEIIFIPYKVASA